MEELLRSATEQSIRIVDFIALIVIVYGSIEAFVQAIRVILSPRSRSGFSRIWFRYGRWLVAGLTFQLAADIIETSTAPSWDDIGRLAAIAVVRTFLNYFLERDLGEVEENLKEKETIHSSG
ncbi:MAG TPA: DUF1622 domain-containing protein [Rhizobiaceae bacterium]|nr:DUF1622 domain-containing protein [Rhizobiaceae bacterium]